LHFWQIGAPPGFAFLLKQAGSVPKEKKMSAMARPQI
jgi:hypothetical protein